MSVDELLRDRTTVTNLASGLRTEGEGYLRRIDRAQETLTQFEELIKETRVALGKDKANIRGLMGQARKIEQKGLEQREKDRQLVLIAEKKALEPADAEKRLLVALKDPDRLVRELEIDPSEWGVAKALFRELSGWVEES